LGHGRDLVPVIRFFKEISQAYLDQDGTIITCVHLQRPREASEAGSAERCTPGQDRIGAEAVAFSECGEAMMEACVLYESWMLLQQALSQVATLVLIGISVYYMLCYAMLVACLPFDNMLFYLLEGDVRVVLDMRQIWL